MIDVMEAIGVVIVALLGIVGSVSILLALYGGWDAFVLYKLWAWLIVPVFGLRALTYWQAAAVMVFVSAAWHYEGRKASDDDDESKVKIVIGILTPVIRGAVLLGMAAIVRRML